MRYEWACVGDYAMAAGIARLLPQLFSHKREASPRDVIEALGDPTFHAIVAIDERKSGPASYVATGSIFFQRTFGRWIAEIHDMVTDWPYRGQGIGRAIVEALLEKAGQFAQERGITLAVYLTSKPNRIYANALYQKLGFELIAGSVGEHGTNLYKKMIS